jgi:hypothetical protein
VLETSLEKKGHVFKRSVENSDFFSLFEALSTIASGLSQTIRLVNSVLLYLVYACVKLSLKFLVLSFIRPPKCTKADYSAI